MELIKYLTFLSAGRKFAIPFHDIRTVLVADTMQPIPEFPEYFAGTCLWEGQNIPVIDARKRFGFEPCEYGNRSCVIVCETNFAIRNRLGLIGLLTDTVAEMADIDPEKLQPCEAVNSEAYTRYLRGVYVDGGQTCYVVDTGMMVNDNDFGTIRPE
ncbi:MAG: chemotaxis protein CheW [Ruminococcus sp.]|nr:chemotaxis protein CheW [Ruminococcus sp.]